MSTNTQFDPHATPDGPMPHQDLPVAHVRLCLIRRMRVLFHDSSREIVGVFVALDYEATMALQDAIEIFKDHKCPLGFALIPLSQVQTMSLID
jgi:hypothetical protein